MPNWIRIITVITLLIHFNDMVILMQMKSFLFNLEIIQVTHNLIITQQYIITVFMGLQI